MDDGGLMEADELAEVDQQLRDLCARWGLAWVVSNVDELVREGQYIIELQEYESLRRYSLRSPSGKRPTPAEFRATPFSATERTLLLIDAMLTVFVELPAARSHTLSALSEGWSGKVPIVGSISFTEDDGRPIATISEDGEADYAAVIANLRALRAMVVEQ
jgi:hypothetical protein